MRETSLVYWDVKVVSCKSSGIVPRTENCSVLGSSGIRADDSLLQKCLECLGGCLMPLVNKGVGSMSDAYVSCI